MKKFLAVVALVAMALPAPAQDVLLPDLTGEASRMDDWILDAVSEPGRVLLRFSTSIPNIGLGELILVSTGVSAGDGREEVDQRIFRDDDSFFDQDAGTFLFNTNISMMEAEGWVDYRLRERTEGDGLGEVVKNGEKPAVCIQSTTSVPGTYPNMPPSNERQVGCGEVQGISVGYTDIYPRSLQFQWIDITGAKNGAYWLELAVDPGDNIVESDETNNIVRIPITLDSDLLLGPEDVNSDGAVNAEDVQLVINGALGLDTGEADTDVSGDGVTNAVDVQIVINEVLS